MEIADGLLTAAPRAHEVAKYQIHAGVGEDRDAMIEALGGGMVAATDDKAEGVAAFSEKRKPDFKGR
jgi:enoyl-CoA hydratase